MNRLAGKVALISGGARGQGAAETRLFVREGAKVVFGDILDDDGKKVEAEIRAAGGEATYVHLNVTREADWRAAVATARERVRQAERAGQQRRHPVAGEDRGRRPRKTGTASWRSTSRACSSARSARCRRCAQAGGGSIINISSTAGLVGSPGGTAAYTATKGAVRLFTKATAVQHAKDNIRCNSVHPGPIATDMIKDMLEGRPPGSSACAVCRWAAWGRRKKSPTACSTSPPTNRPT